MLDQQTIERLAQRLDDAERSKSLIPAFTREHPDLTIEDAYAIQRAWTKLQLSRGQRMVEILKQDQYRPLTVEKQVVIIFAGTQGLLDDLPVETVRAFEEFFYGWLERKQSTILTEIRERKELGDALRDALTAAVQEAKAEFMAAKGIKAA